MHRYFGPKLPAALSSSAQTHWRKSPIIYGARRAHKQLFRASLCSLFQGNESHCLDIPNFEHMTNSNSSTNTLRLQSTFHVSPTLELCFFRFLAGLFPAGHIATAPVTSRRGHTEDANLLGCYAVSIGMELQTFRNIIEP